MILWFAEHPMLDIRHYTREAGNTLALAWPMMAGQVGQMLSGLIDTLMVGHLGTVALAGAAFGWSAFPLNRADNCLRWNCDFRHRDARVRSSLFELEQIDWRHVQ